MKAKNKDMKKKLFYILGAIVLITILISVKKYNEKEKIPVIVSKVKKKTIIETVTASGKVQPEKEVKISSDVSGEIIRLLVKEGDSVKKGDLLVKIRPDQYISAKERAEASLNAAKANLLNSQARLAQVKATFNLAKANFERNKILHKEGAISDSEFDKIKSNFESAKAELDAAEQNVKASIFNVKNAEASLKEAIDNLEKTTIFSPVTGIVSKLNVEEGERVVGTLQMSGTEIMVIANLNEMEVKVDVNENDIIKVSKGDTAIIEVDAYLDKKFKGIVTEIANSANVSGTGTDEVTSFDVKIRILRDSYKSLINKNNPNPFRPGMSATVDIQTNRKNNVLAVPIQAVSIRNDSLKEKDKNIECVFVYNNGIVKQKKVKTGIQDNEYIEIKEGLNGDEEVVTGPFMAISKQLKDGMEVEKKTRKELFNRKKTLRL